MNTKVGEIRHYYEGIGVAVVELTGELKIGDTIHIRGSHTDFTQAVSSMQVEHEKIDTANPGDSIGIKVNDKVREKDVVYKIT